MFSSLLLEFFQETLPLGVEISCSRDGRWRLSSSCCHRGMIPESDGPSQPLFKDQSGKVSSGHGCDGVDEGELLLWKICPWSLGD